jgi:hypothetical protein
VLRTAEAAASVCVFVGFGVVRLCDTAVKLQAGAVVQRLPDVTRCCEALCTGSCAPAALQRSSVSNVWVLHVCARAVRTPLVVAAGTESVNREHF